MLDGTGRRTSTFLSKPLSTSRPSTRRRSPTPLSSSTTPPNPSRGISPSVHTVSRTHSYLCTATVALQWTLSSKTNLPSRRSSTPSPSSSTPTNLPLPSSPNLNKFLPSPPPSPAPSLPQTPPS